MVYGEVSGAIVFHIDRIYDVGAVRELPVLLITATPQRRRIASVLIVLGHAGFVTMIATLANSLRAQEIIESRPPAFAGASLSPRKRGRSILPFELPPFLVQLINVAIIILAVYAIYKPPNVFVGGQDL